MKYQTVLKYFPVTFLREAYLISGFLFPSRMKLISELCFHLLFLHKSKHYSSKIRNSSTSPPPQTKNRFESNATHFLATSSVCGGKLAKLPLTYPVKTAARRREDRGAERVSRVIVARALAEFALLFAFSPLRFLVFAFALRRKCEPVPLPCLCWLFWTKCMLSVLFLVEVVTLSCNRVRVLHLACCLLVGLSRK